MRLICLVVSRRASRTFVQIPLAGSYKGQREIGYVMYLREGFHRRSEVRVVCSRRYCKRLPTAIEDSKVAYDSQGIPQGSREASLPSCLSCKKEQNGFKEPRRGVRSCRLWRRRNSPGRSSQIMVQGALRSAGPCPSSVLIGAGLGDGDSHYKRGQSIRREYSHPFCG